MTKEKEKNIGIILTSIIAVLLIMVVSVIVVILVRAIGKDESEVANQAQYDTKQIVIEETDGVLP